MERTGWQKDVTASQCETATAKLPAGMQPGWGCWPCCYDCLSMTAARCMLCREVIRWARVHIGYLPTAWTETAPATLLNAVPPLNTSSLGSGGSAGACCVSSAL